MRQFALLALPLLAGPLLAACTVQSVETHRPYARVHPELSWVFDCLRTNRFALVSAHRGQKDPEAPENSLASFRNTLERGPILMEIDITRTQDGVLMLLHDDTLDRTTTGSGPIAQKSYRQVRQLLLKDPAGNVTDERVPTLEEALIWAKRNGAILQLDLKRGVPLAEVIATVRAAKMQRQVILIANGHANSIATARAAPEMMVSASGRNASETARLLALANPRMLVFTGTSEPPADLIVRMDAARMEAITGTLGKAGDRLDDRYMADGKGTEYASLAASGVTLIASDRPVDAWRALKSADRDGSPCLLGEKAGEK